MWFCCCLIQCHYSLLDSFHDLFSLLKMKPAKLQLPPQSQVPKEDAVCRIYIVYCRNYTLMRVYICYFNKYHLKQMILCCGVAEGDIVGNSFCWGIVACDEWYQHLFQFRNYLQYVLSAPPVGISRLRTSRATHKSPAKPTWHRQGKYFHWTLTFWTNLIKSYILLLLRWTAIRQTAI